MYDKKYGETQIDLPPCSVCVFNPEWGAVTYKGSSADRGCLLTNPTAGKAQTSFANLELSVVCCLLSVQFSDQEPSSSNFEPFLQTATFADHVNVTLYCVKARVQRNNVHLNSLFLVDSFACLQCISLADRSLIHELLT
jgi:hypothetical protein